MSFWTGFRRLSIFINNNSFTNHRIPILESIGVRYLRWADNGIHTSAPTHSLMEFFDDEKNWSEREIFVGRSWRVEELRIKSNSDLHKLWYVLLKERNMLLTMEHEYKAKYKPFPNPERMDKVEESMKNLERVVRERNIAYYQLETGESGERPSEIITNCFGLPYKYFKEEHPMPRQMNKKFLEEYKLQNITTDHTYVRHFLIRLEEKKRNLEFKRTLRNYHSVCKLLKIFPNVDEEALKEEFPGIDIEKAKRDKRSRGHRENAY